MELLGKYVFIAEGVRGSLAKEIIAKFNLSEGREPQKFGLGMKELWEVLPENHQSGPGHPHHGLAARPQDRRRQLHVSPRGQSRVHRPRGASQLPEPLSLSLHGVPALQASSADRAGAAGRAPRRLWRACHHRGRLPVGAEALLPRRRAHRLLRGLRQRAPHQGFAQCHEDRHDGGRSRLPRPGSGPRRRRVARIRSRPTRTAGSTRT